MRKARLISSVLGGVAFVASAAVVHAGGGGAGGGLEGSFIFTCYVIQNGATPPHVLSVNDQFTDAHKVRVGKAKLLCTLADATRVRGPELVPLPETDHLTCYEAGHDHPKARALVELQDAFGIQTVRLDQPKFICVGSNKTCLDDGCPIVDPPIGP